MSRTVYDIARQLKAPGIATVATFNPARLTMTLRNMTRKSITSGNHNGGWSSKARSVRELVCHLANETPIVYVSQSADYISFITPRPITKDNLSEMIGLLEAECALQKMGYEDTDNRYRPTRLEFNMTLDLRLKENISRLHFAEQNKARNLIVRTGKIRQQLAAVFLRERTVEEIAIAERIAKYLDDDREYNVPIMCNF